MKQKINREIIEEKMKQYNLSQNGLAREAGVSKSMMSRILTGKMNNPTLRTISAIARVLNTSVDSLLSRVPALDEDNE